MYEMTLESIMRVANSDFVKEEALYLVLQISINGTAPEMIVNNHYNFKSKLDYIQQAYNNDLTLKANENIRIVDFDFVSDLEELHDYFNDFDF